MLTHTTQQTFITPLTEAAKEQCCSFGHDAVSMTEGQVVLSFLDVILPSSTRGVTVSTSAFLACHQCYCTGSSLVWGLNLRAVVLGIF